MGITLLRNFIFIGLVNTAAYFIIYSFFVYIGFNYKFAVLFATLIGMVLSFSTFSKFVFNNNNKALFYKFVLVYLILYLLSILFIHFFNMALNNLYLSGFFATGIVAIASFVLNRYYVFR